MTKRGWLLFAAMSVIWGIPYLLIKVALGVVAASLLICGLVYLPLGLSELPSRVPSGRALASLAVLGVVCTAAAFLLFFALIGEAGPVRATVITYVNPAVAVVLGVAFLHESFGVASAAGFALILGGSVLATARRAPAAAAPGPYDVVEL